MNSQATKPLTSPVFVSSGHSSAFERELIALMPSLRAYSRRMCGGRAIADDLMQETLAKALCGRAHFEPGTNLKAWVFTILRNEFSSLARRAWREALWDEDAGARIPAPSNEQEWAIDLADAARALDELPDGQREALILVGAGGFSYEHASEVCGAPIGTVKSRVARARSGLSKMLDGDEPMPRHSHANAGRASDKILAQLSALAASGAQSATIT